MNQILKTVLLLLTLLLLGIAASDVVAANALVQLNWRRSRLGLPAYKFDPVLQAAAERSAAWMARNGRMRHQNHVGSTSGVGMHSGSDYEGRKFLTCFWAARGTAYVGAAVAVGRNGVTYYALDRSSSPRARSSVCPKCGKKHN